MPQLQYTSKQANLLDLVNDVAASLALSTVVSDAAGAAVIHVDSSTTNQLVITVTNQTSGAITVAALPGGASADNYNVLLSLPNDQLYFYEAPTIDATSTPGTWSLATDSTSGGGGWVDSIYLANTGSCVLTPLGQAGDSLTIVINYSGAVPDDPKALNIPVQVSYQNMTNAAGTGLKGTSPAQTMGLMADAGWPSPLLGSIVGPATVLNDGTTARTLTLRMVNTSLDPLQFIVPVSDQPTQSYVEVVLPVSDQEADAIWALCNTSSWDAIQVKLAGSASAGWTAHKSATSPGVITLRPDFSTVTNIPPGGELDLQLTGVVSGLEPGVVQARVSLYRFALIGTQSFGVAIEKSPLIYNAGLGSGMQLASGNLQANSALAISGDSSGNLVQITQSGTGQALQVKGGDATFSNAIKSASATVTGALTAQSLAAASAAVSGNLTAGTASVSGALAVSGNLTAGTASVAGALAATSAAISGALAAGSATINNAVRINGPSSPSQTPSLSLGGSGNFNVDANGKAVGRFTVLDGGNVGINNPNPTAALHVNGSTILNGTVQAIGNRPQTLQAGTYIAPTDGFVIGKVNNTGNYSKVCVTIIFLQNNGVTTSATGGNYCMLPTSKGPWQGPLENSCNLPVAKGSAFAASVWNPPTNEINATTSIFWVPMGTGNIQAPQRIGEAPELPEELTKANIVQHKGARPTSTQEANIADFMEVLDDILGENLDDRKRQRLQDSIRKLMCLEPAKRSET